MDSDLPHSELGVYVHIPFCATRCDYCDFANVDGSRRDHRRVRRGVPHAARASRRNRGSPPRDVGVLRRRHAVPARSPRPGLDPRPDPARRRCRGHGRVQPRLGRRGEARRVPSRGCDPPVVRRPVDGRPRARCTRPDARPRERRARGGRWTRRRVRDVQPRPDLRHPGGEPRRLARHAGRRTRARAAARRARTRSRSSRRRRSGDGSRRARPHPSTTTRPRSTRSPTSCSPPRACPGTRCRTGRGRGTSAGTTSTPGAAATTSRSGAPPTATATDAGGGTSGPRSGSSSGSARARTRWRGRRCSTRRRAPRSRSSWRCGPARGRSSRTAPARRPSASRRAACSDSTTAERVLSRRGRLLASDVSARLLVAAPARRDDDRRGGWHSVRLSANGHPRPLDRRPGRAEGLDPQGRSSRSTSRRRSPSDPARSPGRADLGVSSATVRNEMTVLEREGYLAQPHTSAGRVPTDRGYRFFVDHFTEQGALPALAAPCRLRVLRVGARRARGPAPRDEPAALQRQPARGDGRRAPARRGASCAASSSCRSNRAWCWS